MNTDTNNNRDMFYSGYYGMSPIPNINSPYNNSNMGNDNNYYNTNNYYGNIENRLNRIENQIRSINQRLSRLEVPNSGTYDNNYNNVPDNNMYIM